MSDEAERLLTWHEALRYVVDGRLELDRVEFDAVTLARRLGANWSEIAAALGVTKQSVHRRFARREGISRS